MMPGVDGHVPLLLPRKATRYARCTSRASDELSSFRLCVRWLFVDQCGFWGSLASWAIFLFLAVVVPVVSHFVLSFSPHRRGYDIVVELSLTISALLSFLTLGHFFRRYGLRRFLALDKLCDESERVRLGYMVQLNRSFRLLCCFVTPCFAAETAYKLWWYCVGAERIPFLGNAMASDAVACALELASWIYRIVLFFLVCVLFGLTCRLQILRLQDFASVFEEESDVETVLREHLRIRKQLKIISHRFRFFILSFLLIVTANQFVALLLTTRPHAEVNIFNTGELALCSVALVTGLLTCLRSAAKITHQAQAITSHAAKWHVCATIEAFEPDPETPMINPNPTQENGVHYVAGNESEEEEPDDEDDGLCDTKLVQPHAHTISFQKRQALVTYLENNKAGITVYGFTLDRAWLHTIFMLQLTLFLWVLGKTIGIS